MKHSTLLRSSLLLAWLLCALGVAAGQNSAAPAPGDENWADLFGQAELEGDIHTMVSSGTEMYAGGDFREAGQTTLNGVARWDGSNWVALGTGAAVGVNGVVYAIAVDGNDVYVGGKFTTAGGIPARNIARWNATTNTWSALGAGITGDASVYVGAIAVSGSSVFAGGWFATAGGTAAGNIARWNKTSSTWAALGAAASNGLDGDVLALEVKDSLLYVGGSFGRSGGLPANNIVRWNLNTPEWRPIVVDGVNGINGYVNVITAGLGSVFIGGSFLKVAPSPYGKDGGDTTANVIEWTGSTWLALSNMFDRGPGGDGRFIYGYLGTNSSVRAISIVGDSVYVGGTFTNSRTATIVSGDVRSTFVARWEGKGIAGNLSWSDLRVGTNGNVNAIAAIGRNLFVGGAFRKAGGQPLNRVARWNIPTNSWSGLRSGPSGNIAAVGVRGNEIYAAGLMAAPDGATGYRIARWEGKGWTTFNTTVSGPIYSMAISGNDIYVGGQFQLADNVSAINIARYNLTSKTWNSLGGSGVGGIGITYVAAVAVKGTNLYVGGDFDIADDIGANSVARWDGTKWSPLGTGVNGWINALAVADNGDVYVGGDFSTAGGIPARNIARWDGTKWNALGAGVNDVVRAIAVAGTRVYVGGDFGMAGSATSRAVAFWDGTTWNGMGEGVSLGLFPAVNTISVSGSSVYVGGVFERAGSTSAFNIARWDGTSWNALGSGTDGQVRATVITGTSLYAGGDFDEAGGKSSFKFGEWTAVPNIAPRDGDNDGGAPSIALRGGTPNPTAAMTSIRFSIGNDVVGTHSEPSVSSVPSDPASGGQQVRVTIHDVLGHIVATLADKPHSTGEHELWWDASEMPEGIYYCRMESGGRTEMRAIVVRR